MNEWTTERFLFGFFCFTHKIYATSKMCMNKENESRMENFVQFTIRSVEEKANI